MDKTLQMSSLKEGGVDQISRSLFGMILIKNQILTTLIVDQNSQRCNVHCKSIQGPPPLIHTFIDMHVKLESLLAYPEIHSLYDFKKTLNFTICFYGQERKPRSEATK